MEVTIEFMEAGFFFNKESGMHPEKPLINVVWVKDDKAYGSISTIEGLFYPDLCPDLVTVPENVRVEVFRKYEDKLRPYLQ